ncbi:acetylornithine deacetylase or succinyl-diaminopimelate desuccinylase [Bradyrhizobium sp. YR681]|uniref:M20 family metallopeptidase n=1 Tax=Bradyrhizobium sp. YR681 TaxID=1144344 RepID=UPI00027104AD|nr:M20 family metallopeptidase [Bradyrhizobium sp. YR681]EJN16154.1 acetylornithine deacetylase or succinyl-diaminopimelate desuccinylase [Bradyrhizobium sp. YR681]
MPSSPDVARMKRELAELIAIDTQNPPGHEAPAAQYLRDLLAAGGFDVALQAYKPGRVNVVARLQNGAGPVFAFNTHMDVVPAGEGWSSDPFGLTEKDGRLYGRGACDCKGPLAAMLEAMRMLAADRTAWSGTLLGVFVADEEIASEGAKFYAAGHPGIDAAVVGEPTSNAVFSAHKGSLRPVVRVFGVSAHSGTPHLGENAIYRAGELLCLVAEHHDTVVRHRSHPLVGAASLTVTRINGGHADNVLPGACDLLLDRRMVPGEDEAAVKREIEALLVVARERFGLRAEIVDYKATTGGATETAQESAIVQASLAASRAHGVTKPGPFGFQGACDLVHFAGVGAQGVVIGPGDLAVAHKPDEFVPADEFITSSLIYRDVAKAMLRN